MKLVSAEFNRCAGLGNKLFPWARAKIYSDEHACPMLGARWFSPHGGAITRGGIDYAKALRKIWLVGNFRHVRGEVSRLQYFIKYWNLPVVVAQSLSEVPHGEGHLVFQWNAHHDFLDLKGYQDFLRNAIRVMAKPSQLAFVDKHDYDFIGLNIRCGKDFVTKASGVKGYVQTELDWFCQSLSKIRREYGNMPAVVVSDGGYRQLERLLKEPNVHLLNAPSAIADLIVLSQAKVLLGSGNSTFSAWASFLGEMDTFSSNDTPFKYAGLEDGRGGKKIVSAI